MSALSASNLSGIFSPLQDAGGFFYKEIFHIALTRRGRAECHSTRRGTSKMFCILLDGWGHKEFLFYIPYSSPLLTRKNIFSSSPARVTRHAGGDNKKYLTGNAHGFALLNKICSAYSSPLSHNAKGGEVGSGVVKQKTACMV